MSKSKKPPVDRAVATIRKPKRSDAQKVSVARGAIQAMQASPSWAGAASLQAAVKPWSNTTDALDANAKVLASLRQQVAAAMATQVTLRRDWQAEATVVLGVATATAQGSADTLASLGLDVVAHGRVGALSTPQGLAANPGKVSGTWQASWLRGSAKHGFLVQHGTDPTNASTVSVPTACTKATFKLEGLPSGQSVSIRVAAIDPASPTGQTPWSAWVAATAR